MTSMIALPQVILTILMVSELNRTPGVLAYLGECADGQLVNDPCEVGMDHGFCVKPCKRKCTLQCEADENECTLRTADCDGNATCTNTPGSFTCLCNRGYCGDGHFCRVSCAHGVDVEVTLGTTLYDVCSCDKGYWGRYCDSDSTAIQVGVRVIPTTEHSWITSVPGTIIALGHFVGAVTVEWDNGEIWYYDVGYRGHYQLYFI